MKNLLLSAATSLVLILGGASAQAQDRGYRGPQPGYGYGGGYNSNRSYGRDDRWGDRNDRCDDNDDRRYRDYNQGSWQMHNGNYWNGNRRMSPAEYQRWRRWQQSRGRGRQDWAYEQGVRDGRRQSYGNRRGCR
jgi:hypothetical protein